MRDVLAGLLIFGGLGALGYAIWSAIQARRGRPKRTRVPRGRTLVIVGIFLFLLGGAIAPAEQNAARSKDAAVSEQVAAVGESPAGATEGTATDSTATEAASATAAEEAARREEARAERAAKRAAARAAKVRAQRRAAAKRKAARVRARRDARVRARKAGAAEARRQAALDAAAAPATVDPAEYAGMNCTQIGHSFNVTPGSDPVHDRNNDGVACESS
jgi:hypothetical protein